MELQNKINLSGALNHTVNENVSSNLTGPPRPDPVLKLAHDVILTAILALIMLAMGCTIELVHIKKHLKRPTGILIGLASQFIILPLSSFGLAHALRLPSYQALGLLVISTSPGGSTSNLFSYWVDGDVPLSITMTTMSTAVAMGMMPLNLFIYSRSWTDKTAVIPYENIVIALASILIPVALGILIKWKIPKLARVLLTVGSVSGLLCIVTVIFMQSFLFPYMYDSPWQVFLIAFMLPILGSFLGYIFTRIFCMNHNICRTVAFETGMQNIPLAITLISLTFPREIVGQMILIPLLYGVAMIVEGPFFVILWRIWVVYVKCHQKGAIPDNSEMTKVNKQEENNKTAKLEDDETQEY